MNILISDVQNRETVMKTSKTVILWGREDMLGRGVELFLNARKEWEVIRISDKNNIDLLFRTIEQKKPDVVIIYEGDYSGDIHLPMQLMQARPELMVLTVSLESNSMEVYNKKKVWVKEVSDLLSVVEG